MSTLLANYTGGTDYGDIYCKEYQTFRPSSLGTLTEIQLQLAKYVDITAVSVNIYLYAVDANHKPTGTPLLTIGQVTDGDLTTTPEWIPFTGLDYIISPDVEYAIVLIPESEVCAGRPSSAPWKEMRWMYNQAGQPNMTGGGITCANYPPWACAVDYQNEHITRNFKVYGDVPTVTLISPADDADDVELNDTLQAQIDNLGALTIDSVQLYINGLKVYDGAPKLEWPVGDYCVAVTEYTWKVVAVVDGDEFESETRTFTTVGALQGSRQGRELTIWLGRTGDYDNFEEGVKDADSFSRVLTTTNELAWIASLDFLVIGTWGDEWILQSNDIDTPITPTNATCKQRSAYGSKDIQPAEGDEAILFVDYVGRKVYEIPYKDEGKSTSPDLTVLSEHITLSGIVGMAMQYSPDQILWCHLDNGDLIAMAYKREQNVVGWFKVPIDGFVQSVCIGGIEDEDEIYIAVQRTINGADVIYIEKFALRDFGTDIKDAFFVDCGITFESATPTTTVTGLGHLIGETVAILADGIVQASKVVEDVNGDGQITLDTEARKVQVGLLFKSKLEPLKPVIHTRMGSSAASIASVAEVGISFLNSAGVKFGASDDNLFDINFSDERWVNLSDIEGLFTGTVVVSRDGGFSLETPLIISTDSPLPCVIRCLVPKMEVTGG
jgi:hypothetical protein